MRVSPSRCNIDVHHSRRRRLLGAVKDFDTYNLLRWPVLRLYVLLDAAAAALDAGCLQTFANTGDCIQHGSTEIQALMSAAARTRSSLQPWTHGRDTQMTRREMRNMQGKHDAHTSLCSRPILRDATSPSERSLCNHRFVVDSGTPSASAIFLLPRPWAALFSMAKSSSAERTILAVKNACTHMGFKTNAAVLHNMCRASVLCVDLQCKKKTVVSPKIL